MKHHLPTYSRTRFPTVRQRQTPMFGCIIGSDGLETIAATGHTIAATGQTSSGQGRDRPRVIMLDYLGRWRRGILSTTTKIIQNTSDRELRRPFVRYNMRLITILEKREIILEKREINNVFVSQFIVVPYMSHRPCLALPDPLTPLGVFGSPA